MKLREMPLALPRAQLEKISAQGVGHFIAGEERPSRSDRWFDSIDPFSGQAWCRVADGNADDVDDAVKSAREAQSHWGALPAYERSKVLLRIADAVEKHADLLGAMDTLDNAKLYRETQSQAIGLAHSLRYAAGSAERAEGVTAPTSSPQILGMTIREPYGVIGVIVPWNSPVPLLLAAAAPALAAGNSVVVKTSEDAPTSVVQFAKIAHENGLPSGVLNVVSGKGGAAGAALVAHSDIAKIVFTGGGDVGRKVARGAADRLIPVMLELGGKSPQIVCEDADLERVVPGLVSGVFAAAGQTCVAGGRALIHVSLYEEVVRSLAQAAKKIVLGDPLDIATQIGPLGSERQTENVRRFVTDALEDGAVLKSGGITTPTGVGQGNFFHPTVLSEITASHRIFRDEVFGPVVGLTPFETYEEAIELANDTRYGLAAGVWTENIDRALNIARSVESGTIWVNTYRAPEATISSGGMKESGYGRLGGSRDYEAFTREKTIIINHSGQNHDPFVMGGARKQK